MIDVTFPTDWTACLSPPGSSLFLLSVRYYTFLIDTVHSIPYPTDLTQHSATIKCAEEKFLQRIDFAFDELATSWHNSRANHSLDIPSGGQYHLRLSPSGFSRSTFTRHSAECGGAFVERVHLLLIASSSRLLYTFIACFHSLSSVVDTHTHRKQSKFALVFSSIGIIALIAFPLLVNGTRQLSLATLLNAFFKVRQEIPPL